jgi:hypothetical protein
MRKAQHRCWVCGRSLGEKPKQHNGYAYCSFECACYDGTFSVRQGSYVHQPSLFRGRCVAPKNHHENV